MSADNFLMHDGPAKARAYVKRRMDDALKLRAEMQQAEEDNSFEQIDFARDAYGHTFLCYGQLKVVYDFRQPHPFKVIVPVAAGGACEYPVMTEVQVLAYILARFW